VSGPGGIAVPPGVDPDDLETLLLQPQAEGVWFACPVCRKRFRTNIVGVEPCCTGPHPSLDEHELTPMVRVEE